MRSRSGRPFVSTQPMKTRLPSAARRRASSKRRRVFPAPGAPATYTTRRARPPSSRRSSSARAVRSIGPALRVRPRRPRRRARKRAEVAFLCYGLLLIAWIIDLLTPQLFIVAILFNAPIALSSLALQSRLTTRLVIVSEIANAVAGYYDGAVGGAQLEHHRDRRPGAARRILHFGRLPEREDARVRARSRRLGRAHAPSRGREGVARKRSGASARRSISSSCSARLHANRSRCLAQPRRR